MDKSTLYTILPGKLKPAPGHLIFDCPFCGKTSKAYINTKTFLWDCKAGDCGERGNLFKLLKKLDLLHLLTGDKVDHDYLRSLAELEFEEEVDYTPPEDKVFPIGFKECNIEDGTEYTDYLLSRKFKAIDFQLYTPGYNKLVSKWRHRVILPVFQDFSLKGYTSRYLLETIDDKIPRYINSTHTDSSKLLLGVDEVTNKTDTGILVEGYFDKISTTTEMGLHSEEEMKCFCSFGHSVSKFQVFLLKKLGIKNLILMYDERDSVEIMKEVGTSLEYHFNMFIANTGRNDPGATDAEGFVKIFNNLQKPIHYKYNYVQDNVLKKNF